jgi:hypothetical protein
MRVVKKTIIPALIVLVAIGASWVTWRGCSGRSPQGLTAGEQALVSDLVTLYRLRITRLTDPERATAWLDSLELDLDEASVERELDLLGADPPRSVMVLRAVHDSLEALRSELFPPVQGTNRADEGTREATNER